MNADGGWVVVVFGSGPADGWCTLSHCPMHAIGPFSTSAEAHTAAGRMPEWQQPRILRLLLME